MTLAISSYERLATLADADGVLNLAWTLDEREWLAADLQAIAAGELAREIDDALPFVNSYLVQDPWGEALLAPALAQYFADESWTLGITCGAGVDSLLHALAGLPQARRTHVIGNIYPDFPHWVERSGGVCGSREDAELIFIERPALIGRDVTLDELRELCGSGAMVVVDESYANYYPPSYSAVNLAREVENLAVLRGVSKAYWMGGLRIGWCLSSPAISAQIRTVVPPLLASSLSLRIARAILELGDITAPLRARVASAQAEMLAILESIGVTNMQATTEHVPYVFGSGAERLARCGIVGKPQPFRMEETCTIERHYRLSVPLAPRRMELLRERVEACR